MTDSRLLQVQADRIEHILAIHKVPARVWGGTVTPRFTRHTITVQAGVRVDRVEDLADEIALALGVETVRVFRSGGAFQIEVPNAQPGRVTLAGLDKRLAAAGAKLPPMTAVMGIDSGGDIVMLRVASSNIVHCLIAGMPGSGKTMLARSMIASLAARNHPRAMRLVLIDPKGGRGFRMFDRLPHVLGETVTDPEEAAAALAWLVSEMETRDAEHRSTPAIVIAIDELADLVATGGEAVEASITRLAQRGREAGLHLLAATQKPAAEALSGLLKSSFPCRIVGAVASPEDAKVAAGVRGTGAEKLLGNGDFLLIARGSISRFQAPYVSADDVLPLLKIKERT